MAKAAKAPTPGEEELEQDDELSEEGENKTSPESEDEINARREQRKNEWGMQFDRWLIKCQQKGKAVVIHLHEYSTDTEGITAVPKRIDKYFVQFEINGKEVWINKKRLAAVEAIPAGD